MDFFLELRRSFPLRGLEFATEYSSMVILAFFGCGHLWETPNLRDISMGKRESPTKQNATLSSQLYIGDKKQLKENMAFKTGKEKKQEQNQGKTRTFFQNDYVPKSCFPAGYG